MARLELNEAENEALKKWKDAIKEICGETGDISYTITHTGIGTKVVAHSTKISNSKDITDYGSW
jgi:hypothetical protein